MEENPLLTAGRKHRKLQESAEYLARAADQHSEVAYEYGATPVITSGYNPDEMSEGEAEALLHLLTRPLSENWKEAQEYFMFDLRPEFVDWTDTSSADVEKEALENLENAYDELETELGRLMEAVEQVIGEDYLTDQTVKLESHNSYIASD